MKTIPALLVVGIASVLLVPAASAGAVSTSGLRGLVLKGPTKPVCMAGMPCSAPAPGVVITFTRRASRRSVKTDANGRYRIALAPGTWTISIAGARFGYRPATAVVPRGRIGVRNIEIDTGIR